MPKNKMIKKACPKCMQQVAVASKTCRCGHSFFIARKALPATAVAPPDPVGTDLGEEPDGTVKRRRTERVKREKPNYYDALEYDKQMKKRQRSRNRSSGSLETSVEHHRKKEESASNSQPQLKRKRRGKLKVEEDPEEKESVMLTMSPSKTIKCGVILAEINRRIGAASCRVY